MSRAPITQNPEQVEISEPAKSDQIVKFQIYQTYF